MPKHSHFVRSMAAAAALAIAGLQPAAAGVTPGITARIKAAITANTKGTVRVDQVNTTPIPGVYEVISDTEIFYTEETGRYALVGGALMDLEQRRDLTSAQ